MARDSQAWLSAPTLIYGPRKAGTTLFLRLVDSSGGVFAFPSETKFKNFRHHPKLVHSDATQRYFRACRHLDLDHPLFDKMGYAQQVERIKRSHGNLATVIQQDAQALVDSVRSRGGPPSTFVVKEVGGGSSQAVIELFRKLYPHGRLILITRDPRYVSRAVYRARRRAGVRLGLRLLIREAWEPIRVAEFQRKLLAGPNSYPTLRVRYEDLVGDQLEETMKQVASFLEVPFTPELCHPTLFGEPTVVVTSSRQTKSVFKENAAWTDDLEDREQAAIRLARRVGQRLYRGGA